MVTECKIVVCVGDFDGGFCYFTKRYQCFSRVPCVGERIEMTPDGHVAVIREVQWNTDGTVLIDADLEWSIEAVTASGERSFGDLIEQSRREFAELWTHDEVYGNIDDNTPA